MITTSTFFFFFCQCEVVYDVVECPRDELDQFGPSDTIFSFSFFEMNTTRVLKKSTVL